MYRGWTQTDYQNKHYNTNPKDEGTLDDRRRDGGTNFILRIKEQETRLTLQEHDDDEIPTSGFMVGYESLINNLNKCKCRQCLCLFHTRLVSVGHSPGLLY